MTERKFKPLMGKQLATERFPTKMSEVARENFLHEVERLILMYLIEPPTPDDLTSFRWIKMRNDTIQTQWRHLKLLAEEAAKLLDNTDEFAGNINPEKEAARRMFEQARQAVAARVKEESGEDVLAEPDPIDEMQKALKAINEQA